MTIYCRNTVELEKSWNHVHELILSPQREPSNAAVNRRAAARAGDINADRASG